MERGTKFISGIIFTPEEKADNFIFRKGGRAGTGKGNPRRFGTRIGTGRNPKTGEKVAVPEKYVPHFKPGKELRERVDQALQNAS